MNEILRAQLVLQLVLEDFNLDDESMKIDQALLQEEDSPINLVVTDSDVKNKADEESAEVTDLVGIDKLVDRIEDNPEDVDKIRSKRIKLNILDSEPNNLKLSLSSLDKIESDVDADNIEDVVLKLTNNNSNDSNDLNLKLKSNSKVDAKVSVKDDSTVSVGVKDDEDPTNDSTLHVGVSGNDDITDPNAIHIGLKADDDSDLHLKLNRNATTKETVNVNLNDASDSNGSSDLKVKLKSKDSFNKKTSDFNINLTNTTDNSFQTKEELFIKKRDELIQSDDPNLQLSVCLKIIVDLKQSLDRLISFVPDEVILVKTKYLLGDLLNEIIESSDLILKDPEKLKENIYKIFDLVISINDYISKKYTQLEDRLDTQIKDYENKQINKSISDSEQNSQEKQNNELNGLNNSQDSQDSQESVQLDKTPNINRKKI